MNVTWDSGVKVAFNGTAGIVCQLLLDGESAKLPMSDGEAFEIIGRLPVSYMPFTDEELDQLLEYAKRHVSYSAA